MSKSCAIFGAGGHGKVLAEIAELNGYEIILFFDDNWPQKDVHQKWPVIGGSKELNERCCEFELVVVAIGDNPKRLKKIDALLSLGAKMQALHHPNSIVSKYSTIGEGSVIMAGAIINPFVNIGTGCIINSGAIVEHDCRIYDGVHISPGSSLAGNVSVGKLSWIGIGAKIKNAVSISSDVVIGAGSVVISDVPESSIIVGVPGKPL